MVSTATTTPPTPTPPEAIKTLASKRKAKAEEAANDWEGLMTYYNDRIK